VLNNKCHAAFIAATLFSLALTPPASAADLTVDGREDVDVYMANRVTIAVTGEIGRAVTLLVDISPGPTFAFGEQLELGFTPATLIAPLGTIPASGTLSLPILIPTLLSLHGQTIHLLVAVDDPSSGSGFDFSNGASIHVLRRNVELAATSLGQAPHVAYWRAFNQGVPIEFAVDMTRFPNIVGQSVDVYITSSKSYADWQSNPALVDVAGGPIPYVLAGGGVQVNSFTLNNGTLSGVPVGTDVGVGYDVVIDVDQDGQFGGSDLMDGFSDEAGFYVVHDLTQAGPLAVTEATYTGGTWLGQNLFYPTNISSMGQLPLIVVSHGNGHNYQWYDHIGNHLASYGYIVMSHQNNTQPGSHTAATTTLTNTEYILANQGTIQSGVLNGHIDVSNIVWIGHSRGGDGVVRAYDRVFDGAYVPVNFSIGDIKLVSSIAPVDFGGFSDSHPHDANYHLWVGQSDNDVWGCASSDSSQWYNIYDRATDRKQCVSYYGVGHGDFHDGGGSSVATGPCLIGRSNTHDLMLPHFLALVKHHIEGNLPCKDFLWRQFENLATQGVPTGSCVVANRQFEDGNASGKFVLDDFETNDAEALSSSGGVVTFDLGVREGHMDDPDTNFTHSGSEIWNGFTNDGEGDHSRGVIFSYSDGQDHHLTFEVPAANRDLRRFAAFSMRAAQQTRHPLTTAILADLTFSITLQDGSGGSSTIDIGAYRGGVEDPYQRTGCGNGAGWSCEFETIRVRLSDFTRSGVSLDLADISAVKLEFGPSFGASTGRVAVDDLVFTTD